MQGHTYHVASRPCRPRKSRSREHDSTRHSQAFIGWVWSPGTHSVIVFDGAVVIVERYDHHSLLLYHDFS